ncbi:hypothetical protein [Paenibacillus gallinarum]|uniref:Uncharacterized protein n=1 Tax=Paenibacillus gallinarum TaxID=2762232 RepID=A0ABR8T5H5_9BACL|nr:hypothetical protein [Paenibacillus gallinarum]MBD7970845.1 hypothetical protein [Paenibacillus gallinarum]
MKMSPSERWALYPMHLCFMFLIHFCFGGMNVLWSITYGEDSAGTYVFSALFLFTWLLYSMSMRNRRVDFMILTSLYWLGGLAFFLFFYTYNQDSSITFILLFPFYGSLLGFSQLFINTSYETTGLITSHLLCYAMILLFTLFAGRHSKRLNKTM